MAPETASERLSRGIWKLWERAYVLVFLVFVGLNGLAGLKYGWATVVRYWGAGFAVIGLTALGWTWRCLRKAEASRSWPGVEARILSSRVEVQRESGADDGYGGRITYYYPEVEYEYDVQGLTYRSTKILFVKVNYRREEAQAVVARYPAGGRAVAYFDPANPRMAVLEPGLEGKKGKYAIAGGVGAAFTVAGAAVWFLTPAAVRWFST
jgi:hypothetical protein